MIKTLVLKHFQKHDFLKLSLGRVTVIKGESDVGKSAVVRALYWLAFNRPLSAKDLFLQEGSKVVEVSAVVEKDKIIRRQGLKRNMYVVNGKDLKAVNKGVPDSVSSVLCLSELNFARQHDGPFLFSMSKLEASRYLSSLVGLDEMDYVQGEVESGKRKKKTLATHLSQEVEDLKEELKRMFFVRRMKKALAQISSVFFSLKEKTEQAGDLQKRIDSLSELSSVICSLRSVLEAEADADDMEMISWDVREEEKRRSRLFSLFSDLQDIERTTKDLSLLKEAEEQSRLIYVTEDYIRRQQKDSQALLRQVSALVSLESKIKTLKADILRLNKRMPAVCPECGQTLKGKKCQDPSH